MKPSIYYYNESEDSFEIYLGECSTVDGLLLFDEEQKAEIIAFGATCYKGYGWATEKEIPNLSTVGEIISFLKSEDDIGLIEFEASLSGIGTVSSHDDSEFSYKTEHKNYCMSFLKKAVPEQYRDKMVNKLVSNPGLYISCGDDGVMEKYSSFDEYVQKTHNTRPEVVRQQK